MPDNEYAGFEVGDLAISTQKDPDIVGYGLRVLIEHISVSEDVIRYRMLSVDDDRVFERECFRFITMYKFFAG